MVLHVLQACNSSFTYHPSSPSPSTFLRYWKPPHQSSISQSPIPKKLHLSAQSLRLQHPRPGNSSVLTRYPPTTRCQPPPHPPPPSTTAPSPAHPTTLIPNALTPTFSVPPVLLKRKHIAILLLHATELPPAVPPSHPVHPYSEMLLSLIEPTD
jgi:hypothetical protein